MIQLLACILVIAQMQTVVCDAVGVTTGQITEQKYRDMEFRLQTLEKQMAKIKDWFHSSGIAFTAYYNIGFPYAPGAGEVIPFNGVLINSGNHYDTVNSMFTCPQNGIYFFSIVLNVLISSASIYETSSSNLMIGGEAAGTVECTNLGETMYMECGNSFLVQCNQGQVVHVEAGTGAPIQGTTISTFSGFLVHSDATPL